MDDSALLSSLTPEKYLERFNIMDYVEDAIIQLLEHKDDNPRVNVNKFLSEYFTCLRDGNHTVFRDYTFIRSSVHNRASLVKSFWKCYRSVGRKQDKLSVSDYHSLLCLVCSDFPLQIVQKTAKIVTMKDAADTQVSFVDFMYTFQVQFCYDDFITKCQEVYKQLEKNKPGSGLHDPVYVPTSENNEDKELHKEEDGSKPDGVDCVAFIRALLPFCEEMGLWAPPHHILRDILADFERVTFYGFLLHLGQSERINKHLGNLPPRAKLLDITDEELAAEFETNMSISTSAAAAVSTSSLAISSTASITSSVALQPPPHHSTTKASLPPPFKSSRLAKKYMQKMAAANRTDSDSSSDT